MSLTGTTWMWHPRRNGRDGRGTGRAGGAGVTHDRSGACAVARRGGTLGGIRGCGAGRRPIDPVAGLRRLSVDPRKQSPLGGVRDLLVEAAGGGVHLVGHGGAAGMAGVLIHGRNDLSGGACTPWELARAWPGAELIIIEDSGHTGSTTMTDQMHAAAGRLYQQITNPA